MKKSNYDTSVILNLIQSRRTCYQFLDKKSQPVNNEKLEYCLQAAIYAPNHKLTQPWRFWVIGDEMKAILAHIYADNRAAKKSKSDASCYDNFYQKALTKFLEIPKIVLVGQVLAEDSLTKLEDYAACSCAIQNFQLMAWQQNMGVQWSTGPVISDIRTYQSLQLDPEKIHMIGALYMGNIDENCQPKSSLKRKPVKEVTNYLN